MYSHDSKFHIYVENKPVREYFHEGKYYIEGRKGHEYSISVQNNTGKRKKLILSVDGLNIITGDSTWEKGYVLHPWQTLSIPGWRKNENETAVFEFGSPSESYNEHNVSGKAVNIGVIGCKIFDEDVQSYPHTYIAMDMWDGNLWQDREVKTSGGPISARPRGIAPTTTNDSIGRGIGIASYNANPSASVKMSKSVNYQGVNQAQLNQQLASQSELGTSWGRNKEFKTKWVDYKFFTTPNDVFVVYYDSRRGLIRRGIDLNDYSAPKIEPNPFPTDGCPPPIKK